MSTDPRKAKDIFVELVSNVPPEEWEDRLEQSCQGNDELRNRVRVLLRAHAEPGSFLEQPAVAADATILHESPITEKPGAQIGPYKLLQQIGEGGMGVVFMAEQTEPIQRTVALKIIKPGMDTRQVIARFEAERQALALMDHSNIARVLDAGTTGTGRPFFVMDLVKGVPITEYCDQQHLPIRARLELLTQVCHAVQHAHQKGIIHRDLKPSNVLVAEYDGKPVPKVIDFGVAKATAQRLTEKTMFTEYGQLIGTFEYMSPEQARFNQLDVDTRSDIYSLGVLLYEVLAGSTPLEKERLRSAAFDEVLRIICEEEPPRPSLRLSSSQMLPSISAQRQIEPAKLKKLVAGELDWIVMRCLEKDRNRRYETASSLAVDLQHYLTDEPVEARPTTRTYRLKKFIRRNKVGVLAGSAIVLALTVGLILASIGFVLARTEAVRSETVAQFLNDTLAAAGPSVARGRDATLLREILEKTGKRVGSELQAQPEVQGDLWFILGNTYSDIGDYNRAVRMFQQSVECYHLALGNKNIKLALALGHLGRHQSRNGDIATGNANARLGLEIARKCDHPATLATCLFDTGTSFDHTMLVSSEGMPFLRESVSIRRQIGNAPVALADSLSEMAAAMRDSNIAEAESLIREALSLHRQHLGPEHPDVVTDMNRLGEFLTDRHQFSEAEAVLREAIDLSRKILDKDDPKQYLTLYLLAISLGHQGKSAEVESVTRQAVESYPTNAGYWGLLGSVHACQGDWPPAADHFARGVKLKPDYCVVVGRLAISLLKSRRYDEFRRLRRAYLNDENIYRNKFDTEHILREVSAFLLLPAESEDLEQLCRLGDVAATPGFVPRSQTWKDVLKAQTEYRRGNFQAASDWANRAAAKNDNWPPRKAQAWCIRSAACAQLQLFEAARTALAKADGLIDSYEFRDTDLWNWPDWAIAELLRHEAADLIEQPTSAPESQRSGDKPAEIEISPNYNNPTPESSPKINPAP